MGLSIPTASGIIAVVALRAGGGHQIAGMAIAAGGILMVDAVSVAAARVRTGVARRRPGAGVMALAAGSPGEQAGMESRVCMTGRTCRRKTGELAVGMAAVAGKASVAAGQRKH